MGLTTGYFVDRATPRDLANGRRQHRRWMMDDTVMLLLLCVSGHVFFTEGNQAQAGLMATAVIFAGLLEWKKRFSLTPALMAAVVVFALIHVWQAVSFRYLPLVTFVAFFGRLYVAYAAVCLIRDFPRTYVRVMFVICLVSFGFYVPDQLCRAAGIDFRGCFEVLHRLFGANLEHRYSIGLYNFQIKAPYRNAAFFWEPGAFAGFTLVGIVFLALLQPPSRPREYRATLLVFCVSILTTFSTMGYMVLPIALGLHAKRVISLSRGKTQRGLLLLSLLPAAYLVGMSVWKLEFMSEKVRTELQSVESREFTGRGASRLSSFFFHVPYIKERPVAGWGKNLKTYLALDPYIDANPPAGNGMLRFIHEMGLAGLCTFLLLAAGSFYSLTGRHLLETVLIMVIILLTLQGEEFLTGGLYLAFMFLTRNSLVHSGPGGAALVPRTSMANMGPRAAPRRKHVVSTSVHLPV